MATYGQLLLGSGGGVIDHNMQSARQDGATLIIGLGGTGGKAVQKIKKEVYRQLKPDDVESEIPTYKNIKYLIVDTDPSDYRGSSGILSSIDNKKEFFDISYDAIDKDFAPSNWPILASNRAMDWLNYEKIAPDTAKAGAGGIRQVGRYLLVKNSFELYQKIENLIRTAMTESSSSDVTVHICAGISGGTGSGTFLDVCYLVRRALTNIGVRGGQVCGYFFMPDVNLSVPAVSQSAAVSAYIGVNGYAAMQELDYCMNFDKNCDSFKMDYGNGITIESKAKPVDLCYLISSTNSDGQALKNGYAYAMNVVTDHVLCFLSKVELPPGTDVADNNGLTLQGHVANIKKAKSMIKPQVGAVLDYNILGSSVAEMPLSEIATYLGVKLFENIDGIYNKVPTKKERDDFQVMLKMRYEDIFREMMKDCATEIPFGKKFDGAFLKEKGVGPFNLLHNETYDHNAGIMERNARTLMEPLGDYKTDAEGTGTSLISRLFKALYERCVVDVNYGPFYAKRMLYGTNNEDIFKAVVGLIENNRERMKSEAIQEAPLHEELELAQEKAKKAHLGNYGDCANRLQRALIQYNLHMCRTTAYEKLDKVLTTFRDQIAELDSKLFGVLVSIMDNLRATFRENAKVFSEGIQDDSSYTWKILSIKDVASQLDDTVKDMDVKKVLLDMMKHMFERVDEWVDLQDDNKICKMISDFVLTEFHDATQKTMTDYLNVRYNTQNNTALAKAIEDDIMQDQLWARSTPLFWKAPNFGDTIVALTTLSIPYDSQPIEMASKYLETAGSTVRKTSILDRISMMRFLSGVPMYAYQGLEVLEHQYELDKTYGRHLYERNVDWNTLLPSPIPNSRENGANERQAKKNKHCVEVWEAGKAAGILKANELKLWFIEKIGAIDVDALRKEMNAISNTDIPTLAAFSKKVNEASGAAYAQMTKFDIKVDSVLDQYEEQASLDYFARSPKMVEMVADEIALRNDLAALVKEADEKAKDASVLVRCKDDFFNAIFTGVIYHDPQVVKYINNNYGMVEDVMLCSPEMEFAGSATFQAYKTYEKLDSTIRNKIVSEMNGARTSADPEVVARKQAAIDFVDSKLTMLINMAYKNHVCVMAVQDEVTEFYQDFLKAFQNFKLLNM